MIFRAMEYPSNIHTESGMTTHMVSKEETQRHLHGVATHIHPTDQGVWTDSATNSPPAPDQHETPYWRQRNGKN